MKKLLFSLFLVLSIVSCKDGSGLRPMASGSPYEILVIMDDPHWKAPIGQILDSVLTESIVGLPQPEPFTKVSHVNMGQFGSMMKMFRNILDVQVDPATCTRVAIHYSRDLNAREQYVFTLRAPSYDALGDYLIDHGDQLRDIIHRSEIRRRVAHLGKAYSAELYRRVLEKFDCQIKGPSLFTNYKDAENFVWAMNSDQRMHLMVYSYPYEGPETFNLDYMQAKRDSVLKENVPYGDDDYMCTDTLRCEIEPINVKGDYCMEMRGVWVMNKAFMGGPFVSHSRVDTINNRVIVAEGFVFEIKKKNSTMMRNLESALWTLNLPAKAEEERAAADSTNILD